MQPTAKLLPVANNAMDIFVSNTNVKILNREERICNMYILFI